MSDHTKGRLNAIPGVKGFVSLPVMDRIEQKIERVPFSGCWVWMGHLGFGGYGSIWHDGRHHVAHRLSWEIKNGKSIPSGMEGCHTCDVKACVNPDHIWIGTHQENAVDCWSKRPHHMKDKAFPNPRRTTLPKHTPKGDRRG